MTTARFLTPLVRLVTADSREALAGALAVQVAAHLQSAIEARGRASLAVPGGTTPGPFLEALGDMPLGWDRVSVTLTDERWVPADHARSNERLLRETLLACRAGSADFVPLSPGGDPSEAGLDAVAGALRDRVLPLDVCVLGMGEDLHTASLFPGADRLAEALDPAAAAPVLHGAAGPYLLIHGACKRQALDAALADLAVERAPVRTMLTRPISVYWAE